jgi:hypothetical protein
MSSLQHNKTITVDGPTAKKVVCGSTNLSWRGFFVQSNNAMVLEGTSSVTLFLNAFDNYFDNQAAFGTSHSTQLRDLGLKDIDACVAFSPHAASNAMLEKVADDIGNNTSSCLFYSLAFLYETPGVILDAIKRVSKDNDIFVYGISDKNVGGINLQKPDGNVSPLRSQRTFPNHFPRSLRAVAAPACITSSSSLISINQPPVYTSVHTIFPRQPILRTDLLLIRDRRVVPEPRQVPRTKERRISRARSAEMRRAADVTSLFHQSFGASR